MYLVRGAISSTRAGIHSDVSAGRSSGEDRIEGGAQAVSEVRAQIRN